MNRILPASLIMAAAIAVSAVSPTQAIYNGERAPFDSFAFMVSLRAPEHPERHLCGGTLIAPDIALSAAHCLGFGNPKRMTAVVGTDKPGWHEARRVRITGVSRPPRVLDQKRATATTSRCCGSPSRKPALWWAWQRPSRKRVLS